MLREERWVPAFGTAGGMGKTLVALKWAGPQDVVVLALLGAFLPSVAGIEKHERNDITSCSKTVTFEHPCHSQ